MEHYWSRRAARLAVRVNVASALAIAAPRLAGAALLTAAVVVAARRAEVATTTVGAGVLGVLALVALWVAAELWPRRYRLADAYSRLDLELGLGGALVAARDGAIWWPPRTDARCRTQWRLGRVGPAVLGGPAVLAAALLMALGGAQVLIYPTAIGWLPEEKAELGEAQHCAWETVQRGHAVANGCYVAAVNRSGTHDGTEFWGQSFVANPYGEVVARAAVGDEEILMHDLDFQKVEDFRRIWPFFRDRRVDAYGDLTKRWRE